MLYLRKMLMAGLLVWLPIAATILVIKLVVDLMDKLILLLPWEWRPEQLLGFNVPGLGVILTICILLATGIFAANFFGRQLVSGSEKLVSRIPLVRSIYTSVKQVATTLLATDGESFRKVVLIEYPRKGIWSLGFLTAKGMQQACEASGEELISVFVPTTPNPTSGFIFMLPARDITELDMTIEEGFKFIISMGVITPDEARKRKAKLAQNSTDS